MQQELQTRVSALHTAVNDAASKIRLPELHAELSRLTELSGKADFWQDSTAAQETMKQLSKLERRVQPWTALQSQISDITELSALNDQSLTADLLQQLDNAEAAFLTLKEQLKFNGPYDDFEVILSIHAGAGGTDAQDWAAMLMRMYIRWAERNDFSVTIDDQSSGEEAGIKSVTLEISGEFAYGQLQGEHGVHRLVRLSPFNADALRQTSFAKVEIMPKIDKPEALELDEKDLKIDVYRAGGHGGQSVNTTDSAVRVTHIPTNIVVAIQNERSQLQNKETALTILRSRLAQLQLEQHQDNIRELKGPNEQAAWGNQIRSYVLHPYKQVKDLRTQHVSTDPDAVLDGDLQPFIASYLEHTIA